MSDLRARTGPGPVPTALVALLVVALGVPAVLADVRSGAVGLASVFFPVLAAALGCLAVARRGQR